MRREIFNLDDSKATQCGKIRAKILKESIDIYLVELKDIINFSFWNGYFPEELKMAEFFIIFKNRDNLDEETYRPVSIFSHTLKDPKRLMYRHKLTIE